MKNPVKDHLGEKFNYISRLTVILTLFIMACFTPVISTVEALCGSNLISMLKGPSVTIRKKINPIYNEHDFCSAKGIF